MNRGRALANLYLRFRDEGAEPDVAIRAAWAGVDALAQDTTDFQLAVERDLAALPLTQRETT